MDFLLLGVLFEGILKAFISFSSTRRQNDLMTRLNIRLVGRRAGLCASSVWTYLTCKVFDSDMMRVLLLIVIVLISTDCYSDGELKQPVVRMISWRD